MLLFAKACSAVRENIFLRRDVTVMGQTVW
jgi:hypothetical protein